MTQGIRIKHWTVGELRLGLESLRALDDRHSYLNAYDAAWHCLLLSNPLATDEDLALSLVLDGNVVVGRLGYYAAHYRLQGKVRRMFWLQALGLEPAYRSTGIGGALLLQANERLPSFTASGMPSLRARQIYEALGAHRLGPLPRFAAVLDATPLLYRYTSSAALARMLGLLGNPLLQLVNAVRMRKLPVKPTSNFRLVESLSPAVTRLLERDARFQLSREVLTLNWVLRHLPFIAYEIYEKEELKGYALFKLAAVPVIGATSPRSGTVLYLADFYLTGDEERSRWELLSFALGLTRKHRAARFETQVKGDPLEHVCRAAGLLELEGNAAYVKPVPEDRKLAADVSRWFLTLGSADVILCLGKDGGASQ